MAKAKKAKAKAKKPSKRAAPARGGKEPLMVPVHTVVKFVKMLHDEGHGDHFLETAQKSKAWMQLHPSALRLVRKYVADKSLRERMVSNVIDPIPGNNPYECPCVRQ